ncbi:MAG: hypothetical protein JSV61_16895 [Anaerolineales bacterium]|nr:MAG: hypothetical protein JSV61_16895 [Anaerolineales bacterium]
MKIYMVDNFNKASEKFEYAQTLRCDFPCDLNISIYECALPCTVELIPAAATGFLVSI